MPVDLVVNNAKIVTSEGIEQGGIAIDDGKIVAVARDANLPKASRRINAKGKPVLPGAIDPHVHLGLYNQFDADVRDSTAAQAIGGVTTTMHCILDKRSLKAAIPQLSAIAKKNTYIDMTFYAAVMTMQHINEMADAFKLGVTSFKHFTNRPEYEMLGILHLDDGQMYQSFVKIKQLGGLAMVHCEDFEIARIFTDQLKAKGRKDLAAWDDSRPDYVEHKKVVECAYMGKLTGCPVYVVHNTVGTTYEVVTWARSNGVELYIETCPAYLTLNKFDRKINVLGKVNPPIRTKGHNELLWQGIRDGWVDCIGTDHCPSPKKRKVGQGDIWSALLGYPGSETMLPLLLSEGFNKRGIPLERIVQLTATKTAQIHNIPNKGMIKVGYDADLVIVDPKKKVKVNEKVLRYTEGVRDFSLFEGWTMTGYPVTTIVRGAVVAEDFEVVGKSGHGRVIKKPPKTGPKKPTLDRLVD